MRLAVLPRPQAGRVISAGIARAAWASNAATLLLTVPVLLEYASQRAIGPALPVCLTVLLVMAALALVGVAGPTRRMAVAFLVIGGVGTGVYESLLLADAGVADTSYGLLGGPALSLVMIGVTASRWHTGLIWAMCGFAVSFAAGVASSVVTASPPRDAWGALLLIAVWAVLYLTLERRGRGPARGIPNPDELDEETARLAVQEALRARAVAAVHDTLLNDLSIVMNASDRLDVRTIERLRSDLATLLESDWRADPSVIAADSDDGELRGRIALMAADLRRSGLAVRVSGGEAGGYALGPDVATALVNALRACLENVLRHSGVTAAEVTITAVPDSVTVVVSDEGSGFDPTTVPNDRLGLRNSVVERIAAAGGTAKIWSSPGSGTSIVMRIPQRHPAPAEEAP